LGAQHAPEVIRHLLALDADSRTLRFGCLTTDDRIRHCVRQIDFERDTVFGLFDGRRRLVAMLAIVRSAGAAVRFDGPDVLAQLPLPADTLGLQIQEWIGHHLAALRGPANAWPAFGRPAFGHSVTRKCQGTIAVNQ
jgi:hypothetical protein